VSSDRWLRAAEVGSARALRFAAWFNRRFGRGPSLVALWLTALYYSLRSGETRRSSRGYLERLWALPEGQAALGGRPRFRTTLRHVFAFAVNLYDRMLVWSGGADQLEVEHDRTQDIVDVLRGGRGALLLGAHVGSIDMLGLIAPRYGLVVNVVVFFGNAERINRFFASLDPATRVRAIHIDPESVRAAFEIRACLARGEIVAILADRVPPGRTLRSAEVDFLGASARFPLAPFRLACALDAPTLLALCVCTGPARYRALLRPLSDGGRTPAGKRDRRAHELLRRYADELERVCLEHPLQWFNFFDFWAKDPG
jgi:predicted LPLAT superfamily acyltransferase